MSNYWWRWRFWWWWWCNWWRQKYSSSVRRGKTGKTVREKFKWHIHDRILLLLLNEGQTTRVQTVNMNMRGERDAFLLEGTYSTRTVMMTGKRNIWIKLATHWLEDRVSRGLLTTSISGYFTEATKYMEMIVKGEFKMNLEHKRKIEQLQRYWNW